MITVEDLLMAYASAYDAWLDPEAERENPTPEYAELIRQSVSFENARLRELVRDIMPIVCRGCYERLCEMPKEEHPFVTCSFADRMRELGVEV